MPRTRNTPPGSVAVVTRDGLEAKLRVLGVRSGGALIVHSSLSALGYVVHGPDAVVSALLGVLGPEGTLVVPTFTGSNTDPACWVDPALPMPMWDEVRAEMPLFDVHRSLPRLMGKVASRVLLDPQSRRSNHPLTSFCALGPAAEEIVQDHDLRDPLGPESPIGRVRAMGGQVLLLGVDQSRNSVLAHAHCLAEAPQVKTNLGEFLAEVEGERRWVQPDRFAGCTEGYSRLEDEMVTRGFVRCSRVGDGTLRLMNVDPLVSFAEHKIRLHPARVSCRRPSCRPCRSR